MRATTQQRAHIRALFCARVLTFAAFQAAAHTTASRSAFARSLHFVVVPLVHPRLERRGLGGGSVSGARQFTRSDLVLTGEQWSRPVVGALSDWAIAYLESPALRVDAARVLHQELSWAQHLSLPAVQVGLRSINCAALAGCLNSFLTNMS